MEKVQFSFENGVASVSAVEGAIKLEVKPLLLVGPALDAFAAKVEAGEVDLVKGTDLDKQALLKAIEFIKAELAK